MIKYKKGQKSKTKTIEELQKENEKIMADLLYVSIMAGVEL